AAAALGGTSSEGSVPSGAAPSKAAASRVPSSTIGAVAMGPPPFCRRCPTAPEPPGYPMIPSTPPDRRPPALRRCWLFLPGAERAQLLAALETGADVLIQELEDSTPPERRPEARAMAPEIYAAWRAAGVLAAVRINPLETEGRADLAAVMRGRPDIVLMSKVAERRQVVALAEAVLAEEYANGIP